MGGTLPYRRTLGGQHDVWLQGRIIKIKTMNTKLIEWVLRISVAGEFIGHGVFALQGKKDWIGWFAQFGVSDPATAGQLLFILGIIDIALAVLVLARHVRIALLWMVFWGFWTALLRPI